MKNLVSSLVHLDVLLLIQSVGVCRFVTSRYVHRLLIALARHLREHFASTRTHSVPFRMLEATLLRQSANQLVEPFLTELVVAMNSTFGSNAFFASFLRRNRKSVLERNESIENALECR